MSYQFGLSILSLLGISLVVGMIVSQFILNYPKQCFRLLWEIAELLGNPIDSLKALLRFIVQSLMSLIFQKTVEFYIVEVESTGSGEILILLVGILVLVTFQALSISNLAIVIELSLPFIIYGIELTIDKTNRFFAYLKKLKKIILILLWISFLVIVLEMPVWKIALFALLWLILVKTVVFIYRMSYFKRALKFEKSALAAYKKNQLREALIQYYQALKIYKTPLLEKSVSFEINRAKLLKKIGLVFYKNNQLNEALRKFHQALDLHEKPLLIENPQLVRDRVRMLKKSATIRCLLGQRQEALQCYQLIHHLTGEPAIPKGFF